MRGARDSQTSHALDTLVRQAWTGPLPAPLHRPPRRHLGRTDLSLGLPPTPDLGRSAWARVCVPSLGRLHAPCSAHSLWGPEGLEEGARLP